MMKAVWVFSLLVATMVLAASEKDIADAVRQLGASDFKVREEATRRLWAAGKDADAALEQASQSTDPEVATRARKVLADVRSGITPDTPPEEAELIRQYREASVEERQALATELLGAADPNYDLLGKLSGIETNAEQRMEIFGAALIPAVITVREVATRDEVDDVSFGNLMKTVRLWEAVLPEDPTMPLTLVPQLTKWGKQEQADALFAKAFAAQQQVCARSPGSAEAHNNLAWLCAVARRQLEVGLSHAQKAVELAPKTAAYLDTLAEVEFQLGRQARAVELIKQAVQLQPGFDYFRQQQARMEKGDRASLPPEPDQELDQDSESVVPPM